jgi:type IV secretory pathway VirB2 component (pilin)
MGSDLKEVPMWQNALLRAYVKAQVWARSVVEEARRDLEDPRKKVAAGLAFAAGTLTGSALAQNLGQQLTRTASEILCPIAKFLVGPLAWAAVIAAFVLGIISLAFGGRGGLRWMLVAFAAGIILIVGRTYFTQQANNETGCFREGS